MNLKLLSVYKHKDATKLLWDLLKERGPEVNISHKEMPSYDQHYGFVASRPYFCWFLVMLEDTVVGTTYLTNAGEIGVQIFNEHQRKGYGEAAIRMLIERSPRKKYLANINPSNTKSIRLFEKLGFAPLQLTYVLQL